MTNPFHILVLSISVFCIGCSTAPDLTQYYHRGPAVLGKVNSVPTTAVRGMDVSGYSVTQFETHLNSLLSQGYIIMGNIEYTGARLKAADIEKAVGKAGGDFYLLTAEFRGIGESNRLAVNSFTPGSTTSTQSSWNQSGQFSGYAANRPLSGTTSGTGYGYSSTYTPPSVTYANRTVRVPVFEQMINLLASPQRAAELQQQWRAQPR